MRVYSQFWVGYCAGLITLSSAWAERDSDDLVEPMPSEAELRAWLRLSDTEHQAVVDGYVYGEKRTPWYRRAA